MKLSDAMRLSEGTKREATMREAKDGELQNVKAQFDAQRTAFQNVIAALRTELAESRANESASERRNMALEKENTLLRKERIASDELHAKVIADTRAIVEATKPAPASPPCGYSLRIVSRDGNNDMQELRIEPSKGGE